jgi:hypothetical protein
MELTITSVDHAPEDLYDQVPLVVDLIREIPGDDRPDYWLGALRTPIRWLVDNHIREVTHLVLAARWQGTAIAVGAENLPIGIAYVTDQSVLNDAHLKLSKCAYVAIGLSTETGGGAQPKPLKDILAGTISRGFGTVKPT